MTGRWWALSVGAAVGGLILITYLALQRGPISSADTATYVRWSQILIEEGFDLARFYASVEFVVPPSFYTVTVVLVAALRVIDPAGWKLVFVGINIGSIAVVLGTLLHLVRSVRLPSWVVLGAVTLFLAADGALWPAYVLADTYYAALVMLILPLLMRQSWGHFAGLVLLLLVLLFTRPTAPAVVAGVVLVLGVERLNPVAWKRWQLCAAFGLFLVASALLFALAMELNAAGILRSEAVGYIRALAEQGQVIYDRPETWIDAPTNFLGFAGLFLVRFGAFFLPWVPAFSLAHNVATLAAVGCFVVGLVTFFAARPDQRDSLSLRLQLCALVLIFCGAVYHSATFIDFDWRYRFPYAMPMAVFTMVSIAEWFQQMGERGAS